MKYTITVLLFSLALLFSPTSAYAQSLTQLLQENSQVKMIDLKTDISIDTPGITAGSSTPDVNVYVFADITEGNFSGKILTKNIPDLLETYPTIVRVWYIHSVLTYRDNPNTRNAITTMVCLGKENKFWNNINKIVETKGQWDTNYSVDNPDTYRKCLMDTNTESVLNAVVQQGQTYMTNYNITGVPTALFVSVKNPTRGLLISGAYPSRIYKEAVEQVQHDSKEPNEIETTLYPLSNNVRKLTIWDRFKQFIQSFFLRR